MQVGDIKTINEIYTELSECLQEFLGVEVCVIHTHMEKAAYSIEATVISGMAKGEKWLFNEDELS